METPIDSTIPPPIVLLLVCLALLWGVIVACYIANVAWAVCFAQNAIISIQESHQRRQAVSRRQLFVVGDHYRRHESEQRLIRAV